MLNVNFLVSDATTIVSLLKRVPAVIPFLQLVLTMSIF